MESVITAELQNQLVEKISPNMVWIFFAIVLGLTIIVSIIVLWHWFEHGKGVLRKTGVEIMYIIITGGIVVALFINITKLIPLL